MLLRPRQKELVSRAVDALHRHGNTLAVAPTGSGKTVMLSAVIGELLVDSSGKACVLAHRDELTIQNQDTFGCVNPHLSSSLFNASQKSWEGQTAFAMVQTLSRDSNLATMPSLDVLVVDEAHHVRADSYRRIIDHARAVNPDLKLLGVTATPHRGDRKGLGAVFSNVCDQITVDELIASGHLVRPRTFVMDVGTQQKLGQVRKTVDDYDMDAVAEIMDTRPVNEAVITHWQEKAGDRQTVVFCSTVAHARHMRQCFIDHGIAASLVYGEMSEREREQTLLAYASGAVQVMVNVSVLTEGWDDPPTSCIVLLRPSSHKSTLIQMIGRGLRPVNPQETPDLVKTDCMILDFGTATLNHGKLEEQVHLEDKKVRAGGAPYKLCPDCSTEVPSAVWECPCCCFLFEAQHQNIKILEADDFTLSEIDVLTRSSFRWQDPTGRERSWMCQGFNAWSGVFYHDGQWYAMGALMGHSPHLLARGEKVVCMAAGDDFMNRRETESTAHKTRGWLNLGATDKQLKHLPEQAQNHGLTRYHANLLITLKYNTGKILRILKDGGQL